MDITHLIGGVGDGVRRSIKKNILSICMYVYAFTHTHARTHIYTHKAGTFKRVEVRNIYRVLIYPFK